MTMKNQQGLNPKKESGLSCQDFLDIMGLLGEHSGERGVVMVVGGTTITTSKAFSSTFIQVEQQSEK